MEFRNVAATFANADSTCFSLLETMASVHGKYFSLLAYSGGAYVAWEVVHDLQHRGGNVDCLVIMDPAFKSDNVPMDLAERVMASSVMDEIPDDLDAPRFREALVALFPSYAARFAATEGWFGSPKKHGNSSLVLPVLLLISTDWHPAFGPVAGGLPAELEWKRRLPQALVVHVKSSHLSIPYTSESGWNILQFLACVSGGAFSLEATLAGQAKFAEVDRVMESARQSFRRAWRDKYFDSEFCRCATSNASALLDSSQGSGVPARTSNWFVVSFPIGIAGVSATSDFEEHADVLMAQGNDDFAFLLSLDRSTLTAIVGEGPSASDARILAHRVVSDSAFAA